MRRLAALAAPIAALAAAAALIAPAGGAANECSGIPKCIAVPGPWVAVPATGGTQFLLECPGAKGIIGGTAASVTSQDIHVTFDGIMGSPVAYGRTTNYEALFRAVSADHRPGAFEPFIGCIPTKGEARSTTGVTVEPVGPPLDLVAKNIPLAPGAARTGSLGCPKGEVLVDAWTATAFATKTPPAAGLATAIRASASVRGHVAVATATASEALPRGAKALIQLGVRCNPA